MAHGIKVAETDPLGAHGRRKLKSVKYAHTINKK